MTEGQCTEFECKAFNSSSKRCLLSGKKIVHEYKCSRYNANKQRQSGLDKKIKENLCVYDKRSPYFDEENGPRKKDCLCDNCFHGLTWMAELLLKLIGEIN